MPSISPSPAALSAAPARAAPSPAQHRASASSSASSTSSTSIAIKAGSPTNDIGPEKKGPGGSSVQPSKEWVLPARAKPGRKPSETEPPTKRKAQNRASQRAFRERKQMYLADLEAKVAAYEKAEIDRSVEIQKAAKRLKDENDLLRKENASLKERYQQLEAVLASVRAGGKVSSPLPATSSSSSSSMRSSRTGPGCKAPAHETRANAAGPRKSVLASAGGKGALGPPRGEVRFADDVDVKSRRPLPSQDINAGSLEPEASSSVEVIEPTSPSKAPLPISTRSYAAPPSAPALWNVKEALPLPGSSSCSSRERMVLSPPLMGKDHAIPIEGGCGFCTDASPCVCADDFLDLGNSSEKADSPGSDQVKLSTSARATPFDLNQDAAETDAAAAIPLRKKISHIALEEQAPSMRIDSLTNAAAPGREPGRKRLWYTVPSTDAGSSIASRAMPPPSSTVGGKGSKKKLWYTVPASGKQSFNSRSSPVSTASSNEGTGPDSCEPVCTGDPSRCAACSTDPGLAAFCEAVTNSVRGLQTTFTSWDAGNAIPLSSRARSHSTATQPHSAGAQRPALARFGTTGHLQSSSSSLSFSASGLRNAAAAAPRHLAPSAPPSSYSGVSARHQTETITSAWRQIRSHPRFDQWQGGLDLLAEVVSRRSGSVHSPLLGSRTSSGRRADSVEIEPVRRTATGNVESHDRATRAGPEATVRPSRLIHTASDSTIQVKRERDADVDLCGEDGGGSGSNAVQLLAQTEPSRSTQMRESKRRRILVEREAVQEALALLDRGTAQFPVLTSSVPLRLRSGSTSSTRTSIPYDGVASGSSGYPEHGHERDDTDGPCPCPWWRPNLPCSGSDRGAEER